MSIKAYVFAALAYSLTGCAGVTSSEDKSGDATGIRYYDSAPFILAYSDGKGGIEAKLIYLPDTTRVLSMDPTAFFAQNKTEIAFEDSVLKTSNSTADAALVPKAIIEAAKTIATSAIAASGNAPEVTTTYPAPYLYRIDYGPDPGNPNKKAWRLVGGQGLDKTGTHILPIKSTFVRVVE